MKLIKVIKQHHNKGGIDLRRKKGRPGKPVKLIDLKTLETVPFDSVGDCARYLKLLGYGKSMNAIQSMVSHCLNNISKTLFKKRFIVVPGRGWS